MYIAYYGRPGDPSGVEWWAQKLDDSGGNMSAIIESFGNSQEYIDSYGGLDEEVLIRNLYQQMFGRDPDSAGLEFYVGELSSGDRSLASIALDIANGVQGPDIDRLYNRLDVAQSFTEYVADNGATYGENQIEAVKVAMSHVTILDNSVIKAIAELNEIITDNYTADVSTAGAVGVNSWKTSNIEIAGDEDWFSVFLETGHSYQIDLRGQDSGSGTLSDPYLDIFTKSGELITSNDDGGNDRDSQLIITPSANGNYFISASSYAGIGTGSYRLAVTDLDGDPSADIDTSGYVVVDNRVIGDIETASDEDWFSVSFENGHSYEINLRGAESNYGTLSDTVLHLYNALGEVISFDNDGGAGTESRLVFSAFADGEFFIGASSSRGETGSYDLEVTDLGNEGNGSDLRDDIFTSGSIEVNTSVLSDIETAGDEDWFSVFLEEERTYQIDLRGLVSGNSTLPDPVLNFYNASGDFISQNDDGGEGTESQLIVTASYTGDYFIGASSYSIGTGTYDLEITDLGAPDFSADIFTSGFIEVNDFLVSEIETADDEDWFYVFLEEGASYQLDLRGEESGYGTLYDPLLNLYNEFGEIITSDDDGGAGLESQLIFVPDYSGYYLIGASSFGGETGTYDLEVSGLSIPDFSADIFTSGFIEVNTFLTSDIETFGDEDWFYVFLEEDISYQLDLRGEASGHGTLQDPFLNLYNEFGEIITSDDDGGTGLESQLLFTPSYSGYYLIGASSFGGETGSYDLEVTDYFWW